MAIIGAPVLYVLSAGPFGFFVARGLVDANVFDWFYAPLAIIANYLPEGTTYLFSVYVNWWAALARATGP